jgi:digeranylgeranylglycerophospholipid reductase
MKILIVGGGPAGLYLAYKLGKDYNLESTVLEADKEIGKPIRCAEAVSLIGMNELGIDIQNHDWKGNEIYGAKLYAPSIKKYIEFREKDVQGYVMQRDKFEKHLAKLAEENGAKIYTNSEVVKIDKENKIAYTRDGREFEYDLIVGADGCESIVAREFGFYKTIDMNEYDTCYEYLIKEDLNLEEDILHMFISKTYAPRGYIWIFPKGNKIFNVGIGVKIGNKSPKRYLDEWIEKFGENFGLSKDMNIIEKRGGIVPLGGFLDSLVDEKYRAVLVGDAARQVHPLHGGGIELAMHAANILSEQIYKYYNSNNIYELKKYEQIWEEKFGRTLRKTITIRDIAGTLPDAILNFLADKITFKEVFEIFEGKDESINKLLSYLNIFK